MITSFRYAQIHLFRNLIHFISKAPAESGRVEVAKVYETNQTKLEKLLCTSNATLHVCVDASFAVSLFCVDYEPHHSYNGPNMAHTVPYTYCICALTEMVSLPAPTDVTGSNRFQPSKNSRTKLLFSSTIRKPVILIAPNSLISDSHRSSITWVEWM